MKRKLGALLLAAVIASTMLVGCGGGNNGDGDSVTYAIGVASPYTQGSVSIGQGIKRGAQLAIETMNKSDEAKAAGVQFKMVEGDDMGDPKTAVTVANTLVSDRSLIGVVGHYNSGCSIPASKVYDEAGVVMVSPGSTNPDLTTQGLETVFRTCATDALQGPEGAKYAYNLGLKTAVVVDDSTPYGEGLADQFETTLTDLGGTTVLREKTQDKDSDFNALVTKINSKSPDIVYYAGMYNAGALFARQLHEAGVTAPVMGGDGLQDIEYIKLGGNAVEGDYGTNVGLPVEQLPEGQKFIADYDEVFPNDDMGAFDAYAYDAAYAIMKAAIAANAEGKVTSPAGREALLAELKGISFEGVTGTVSFDENGDTNNKVISLYRVADGAWNYVDPDSITASK